MLYSINALTDFYKFNTTYRSKQSNKILISSANTKVVKQKNITYLISYPFIKNGSEFTNILYKPKVQPLITNPMNNKAFSK
jgi:hypothetical protein